ncbi:MAG TPA: hypothetical protein VFV68_17530, partial [Agriterribacter sp.]|nr:hypothetical protein [Agriterribacter sp.]
MKRKFEPKLLFVICGLLMSTISLQAQKKTVSGTVRTAEEGLPLSGVSVVVQGDQSSATVTNDQGKF